MTSSQLLKAAPTISLEDALRKALELLDEAQTALAMSDRRYNYQRPGDLTPRATSTRGLVNRIDSFNDITRTFILRSKGSEELRKVS